MGVLADFGDDLRRCMVNNRLLGFFVRRAVTCMVMWAGRTCLSLAFITATPPRSGGLLLAGPRTDGRATLATTRSREGDILGGEGGDLDAQFLCPAYRVGQLLGFSPAFIPYGERALRTRPSSAWAGLVAGQCFHRLREVINQFSHPGCISRPRILVMCQLDGYPIGSVLDLPTGNAAPS